MIEYIEGDIFESPAQVIVNTVNTVGVMGKGLALSFKKRYPDMFEKYKIACEKHLLTVGKLMLFYEADHWLLMFPTKENWRYPSKLEYIEKGLLKFVNTYADKNITSIAFPRLGCGNGELDWNDVKPLMERYLKKLPIDVYIYLGTNPDIIPEHNDIKNTASWLRENAKDMSYNGVKDDLMSLSSLFPYSFEYDDSTYELSFTDELTITNVNNKAIYVFTDDEFYQSWDYIRNQAILSIDEFSEKESVLLALLCNVGYLSKIKVYNNKTHNMVNGYQINSALGRVMAFKEA